MFTQEQIDNLKKSLKEKFQDGTEVIIICARSGGKSELVRQLAVEVGLKPIKVHEDHMLPDNKIVVAINTKQPTIEELAQQSSVMLMQSQPEVLGYKFPTIDARAIFERVDRLMLEDKYRQRCDMKQQHKYASRNYKK